MQREDSLVQPVIFTEQAAKNGKKIGIATLNAEKSLNALSLDMIRLLSRRLAAWRDDPALACVVLNGAGDKAFCAGGDVRALRNALVSDVRPAPHPVAETYFAEEYALDYAIHTYPKPILLWGNGIVMGGGLGLMAGASHRVVTETSRIAMPEITIGLYPDVGGSWFLNRMPGRTGLFLALTGASINAADAQWIGLADFAVRADDKLALCAGLLDIDWQGDAADHGRLSQRLREFAARGRDAMPAGQVEAHFEVIQWLTDVDSLAEFAARLAGHRSDDPWLHRAAKSFAVGSPTSAALSWELRRRARHLSLAEVFRLELGLSVQCCAHPDFVEGVRALLVDKDNAPAWTPAMLAAVTPAWLDDHFVSPWPAAQHPLAGLGRPAD